MATFKYWEDCVHPVDMKALWADPQVSTEWLDAGEVQGQKVHLSRDPEGQPYLTQTEMRAVADIIVRRHFRKEMDPDTLCAIADLESDRQPLATRYVKKTKETTYGIMQLSSKTAEWLYRELGYKDYEIGGDQYCLFRPFVNVYLGAAYLNWLANFEQKERSEEFVVRAFKGGTKKAVHKSTLPYWKSYLSVKEGLPSRKLVADGPSEEDNHIYSIHEEGPSEVTDDTPLSPKGPTTAKDFDTPLSPSGGTVLPNQVEKGEDYTYWDARTSAEDMEEMWMNREVHREWMKSRERRGHVRFSRDGKKRLYVSKVELKAVAQIILSKYFSTKGVKPTVLCAMAEITSMRFVDGIGSKVGLMGIDYPTAQWLYKQFNRAYKVESSDDLKKPFVSMYFGAAYMAWLSEYEGRERSPKFVVQAYLSGPKNAGNEESGPGWLKFEEALSRYEDFKANQGSCSIL